MTKSAELAKNKRACLRHLSFKMYKPKAATFKLHYQKCCLCTLVLEANARDHNVKNSGGGEGSYGHYTVFVMDVPGNQRETMDMPRGFLIIF